MRSRHPATLTRDGVGQTPRIDALVTDVGGDLVAFESYSWNYSIWLADEVMHIDAVYDAPAYRNRGIGPALMTAARGCAGTAGVDGCGGR